MIKARLHRWRLDKKLKWQDVCTVALLLAVNGDEDFTMKAKFQIRGQIVTYPDVLRYFRRKKIQDPLAWIRDLPENAFAPSSDVVLLTPSTGSEESDSESPRNEIASSPMDDATEHSPETEEPASQACTVWSEPESRSEQEQSVIACERLLRPVQHVANEHLQWCIRDYCSAYIESPHSTKHDEPKVHQYTVHGLFGQRIQDGISHLSAGQTPAGINSLDSAFGMIRELLRDNHPMSLLQVLATMCELNRHQLQPVIRQLIAFLKEMATIELSNIHPLAAIFSTLGRSGAEANVLTLILAIARAAVDHITKNFGRLDWKTLYLKERFCDCLYHAHVNGERVTLRAKLLKDQELKYGKNVRNVVYTLTNVADDCVEQNQLAEAERLYNDALARADHLQGFGRAKIRFAALEGLAKAARARGGLGKAVGHLVDAETEARVWFEPSSRRTTRVGMQLAEIRALVAGDAP